MTEEIKKDANGNPIPPSTPTPPPVKKEDTQN